VLEATERLLELTFLRHIPLWSTWATIRKLLILSTIYKLSLCQVYYTAAFVHAEVKEDMYIDIPCGFRKPGKVLKLKNLLNELQQTPSNFFKYLKSKFAS